MNDRTAFMIGLGFVIAIVFCALAAFGQSNMNGGWVNSGYINDPVVRCVNVSLGVYTCNVSTDGWVKDGYTDDPAVLCVNGHPAHRRPNVTYGGLPIRACCERDHICPLGLGCPDTIDNLQYQPWPEARVKDGLERYAEEAYCRDPSPALLDQMRRSFSREYPRP